MNNIKKFRLLSDKTQSETANYIGVTQHTYSNYELGKTQPDFETLIKLADYFHVTVDSMLGHEVPYLLDKSTLTQKQKDVLALLLQMDDRQCEKAEAYFSGLIEGSIRQRGLFQRFEEES